MSRAVLDRLGVPRLWGNEPDALWRFMRYTVGPVTFLLAPARGYGAERVPLEGGAVLASNHLSAIDPPLVGGLCPRPVYWMAKAELLELPVVGGAVATGLPDDLSDGSPATPTGLLPFRRLRPDAADASHPENRVRAGGKRPEEERWRPATFAGTSTTRPSR